MQFSLPFSLPLPDTGLFYLLSFSEVLKQSQVCLISKIVLSQFGIFNLSCCGHEVCASSQIHGTGEDLFHPLIMWAVDPEGVALIAVLLENAVIVPLRCYTSLLCNNWHLL